MDYFTQENAILQFELNIFHFFLDGQYFQFPLQVFLLAALVAVSSGRPRYLVIPLEDVDFEGGQFGQLPVYRIPQLARQARAAQEEDSFQSGPGYQEYQEPRDNSPAGRSDINFYPILMNTIKKSY